MSITYFLIQAGTPEEWREMMDVNVIGLSLCTKETIASLIDRKVDDGHIINIGR